MAFPTISAQQETTRKILEDLQIKKQLLQKGVSPPIPILPTTNSMTQFMPTTQVPIPTTTDTIPLNSTARSANSNSNGFFIPQDSIFGNSILPVLPRLDNPAK